MDEAELRVMMVEIKSAVSALAESVNLKLDRLGDRIDNGDNRTMQALLLTDERLTGTTGRLTELAKRVDNQYESMGKRLDAQRDDIEALEISRAKLVGLAGGISFVVGSGAGFITHFIK